MSRKRRSSQQLRLEATAYHEAGHIVMARKVGMVVAEVFIEGGLPRCRTMLTEDWEGINIDGLDGIAREAHRQFVENRVKMLLAGRIAQRKFAPHTDDPEHYSQEMDAAAHALTTSLGSIDEIAEVMRSLEREVKSSFRDEAVWSQIKALAELLTEARPLTAAQIYAALAQVGHS